LGLVPLIVGVGAGVAVRSAISRCRTTARAKTGFEEAHSYLPRSPDPHLGLARIYVYHLRNIGRAVAELSDAERLGFKPGPREFEQQADGYLVRAESELRQAQKATLARADAAKYLALARGDLDRARNLQLLAIDDCVACLWQAISS
jgi:hypothetical protein